MNKIQEFLQHPAAVNKRPWVVVVIASLIVFFLLAIFQPFGLSNLEGFFKWKIIVGFGLITSIGTSIVCYLFPWIFPRFYDPERWTEGKNLFNQSILILVIGLGNFIFDWTISNRNPETFFAVLLSYLYVTFLVGLVPAIIITYIIQNSFLKQNLKAAKEMNKLLLERINSTQTEMHEGEMIVLSGNTKETLEIYPEDILYLEVSGNYVSVYYRDRDNIKQKQLRTTIAQIAKELQAFSDIVRCHRAFMVNIRYIINVEGNSQGFQLSLRYSKNEIPVSRTYTAIIRDKIDSTP